ncbi:hypothetical protein GDO86_012313 [Hymenochirus boettgeri]|uniref:C-X-C chemokine receptor type 3 n=1 Tax=Hymenochirus boettgeri TaxID=247094 RepID=A0A8T2IPI5_9PIPI|nr:hypothetical protein GDO86_012313 [Hymenochirus boettgeri]
MAFHEVFNLSDLQHFTSLYDSYSSSEDGNTAPCSLDETITFDRGFLPAFYSLLFFLGMAGNVLVMVVLLQNRLRLQSTDVFLLHLAAADILLVVTLPFWAVQAVLGWLFGNVWCKFVASVFKVNFYACTFLLVCISCDRYLSIVYAIQIYKKHRSHLVHWSCALVWGLCIGLTVPDMIYFQAAFDYRTNMMECQPVYGPTTKTWRVSTTFLYHILGFLLPLCFMLYCYTHIILTLLQTRGFKKQKALRVIIAVVLTFFLCWTPYNIVALMATFNMLQLLADNCTLDRNIDMALSVTSGLCYFHCCLNPFLYAFVGAKFKMKFLELLNKMSCVCPQSLQKYLKEKAPAKSRSSWSESGDTTISGL